MSATPSKKTQPNPRVVVVLGMHRSGTSALMGAFHKLGLRLGDQLLPERDDNRTGFWESKAVVTFNQSLNQALNRTWHEIVPMPDGWWKRPEFKGALPKLQKLLVSETEASGLWGMKDPRTCRSLPIWQKAFQKAALKPVYCLTLRHPAEVAASLEKRDGFGHAKSLLLWLDHVLSADWHTRKSPRIWIHYPDLLQNPIGVIESASESLGLPWSKLSQAQAETLKAFLKPSLRNHKAVAEGTFVTPLAELCQGLYEKLRSAPESKETRQALSKARREWRNAAGLFSSWVTDQNQAFDSVHQEIQAARNSHMARDQMDSSRIEHIDAQQKALNRLEAELLSNQEKQATMAESLEAQVREAAQAREHIESLVTQIQIAKSVHDDQLEQIQTARQSHEQKDQQLDEARRNIAELQSQIETAVRVHEDKERQIESARGNMALLERQIDDAREVIADKDREIERARGIIADKDLEIERAREVIAEKDREIDRAREGFVSLQEQIQHARDIQANLAKEIEAAKTVIQSQSQELAQARWLADEARKEIDQARENIEILCGDIEVARDGHRIKDGQIAEAQTLLDTLLADLTIAKEGHDIKDQQLDQARAHIAALQSQVAAAQQLHSNKDEQIQVAQRQIGQLKAEMVQKTERLEALAEHGEVSASITGNPYPEGFVPIQALTQAQAIIAGQAEEIEIARQVHDQKMAEIDYARQVHDEMANRLEEARNNIANLANQIERAHQAHQARDQIEAELRRQLYELRHPAPAKHHASDPTLRPQTES